MLALEMLRCQVSVVRRTWRGLTDGLTPQQAHWRPPGAMNPIVAVMLHVIGLEDRTLQGIIQARSTVWEQGDWGRLLGAPLPGNLELETARALRVDLSLMQRYVNDVMAATEAYLAALTEPGVDQTVRGHWGPTPVGELLSGALVTHMLLHVGEIAALKACQDVSGHRLMSGGHAAGL